MRALILVLLVCCLVMPVSATEFTPPEATGDAQSLLPDSTTTFGADLWTVMLRAMDKLQPAIAEAIAICSQIVALMMLLSLCANLPGNKSHVTELAGVIAIAVILLGSTRSMVSLAVDTVSQLSEYGKLLIPVLAAAITAQGGTATGMALYTGTIVFDAVLSTAVSKVLVPIVYVFLVLVMGAAATDEPMLHRLQGFAKWICAWFLKGLLYIFTGYMAITGVVSGSTDAMALKATKITMSGMVPVVGGILADASESVLVGAGVMKNAVGIYGTLALIAIGIVPFLRIGTQYILLKLTAGICQLFDVKSAGKLMDGFCTAMGLLLGMVGAVCIMLLISVVCFMKGMM